MGTELKIAGDGGWWETLKLVKLIGKQRVRRSPADSHTGNVMQIQTQIMMNKGADGSIALYG